MGHLPRPPSGPILSCQVTKGCCQRFPCSWSSPRYRPTPSGTLRDFGSPRGPPALRIPVELAEPDLNWTDIFGRTPLPHQPERTRVLARVFAGGRTGVSSVSSSVSSVSFCCSTVQILFFQKVTSKPHATMSLIPGSKLCNCFCQDITTNLDAS